MVRAYLHKPPLADLEAWQAIDPDGTVQIDTGLIWFDRQTFVKLVALARLPSVSRLCGLGRNDGPFRSGLNLYGDLLLPLAQSTTLPAYLADESEGPPPQELLEARRIIWDHLRGIPFSAERLHPAVFGHFGTSSEYWQMVADDPELARLCGWEPSTASWVATRSAAMDAVLINSAVAQLDPCDSTRVLILDSDLDSLAWAGFSIVASVRTGRPLRLGRDLVIHQLPVADGFVTRIYGLYDNPKDTRASQGACFLNVPWPAWLDRAQLDPAALWPRSGEREQSLWDADLYPVCADRDESLAWALTLQQPDAAPPGWQARWAAMPRLSLAESYRQADGERILCESVEIEDKVASRRFLAMIRTEAAAAEAAPLLGTNPETITRRGDQVAALLGQEGDRILALRGYKALAASKGQMHWEDRAFAELAGMIRSTSPRQPVVGARARGLARAAPMACESVRVHAAARVDLGGGWTDTPPYSIERGGTVLNAAVTLNGAYPITATASWLSEHRLIIECEDIGATLEPKRVGEVLDHTHPSDPFALPKAALVLQDIVPASSDPAMPISDLMRAQGRGVYLGTQTSIPRGSGLGTSSILGGAVLAATGKLLGVEDSDGALFDRVLVLEQMLTTGGGWQDQVGGLVGGIKLVTSEPGLPQRIQVRQAGPSSETRQELASRLLLVYTGQQRLAKNLLRAVMGRWMARDPEMVWILGEIARLAEAMWAALRQGDVDALGPLLREHWRLNKLMDPGCSNPFIDGLFESMEPYVLGGKVAGAGGGGFAIVIGRDAGAGQSLDVALRQRYPGTQVAVWPSAIPDQGRRAEVTGAPAA